MQENQTKHFSFKISVIDLQVQLFAREGKMMRQKRRRKNCG
jgi:hypothetical protein